MEETFPETLPAVCCLQGGYLYSCVICEAEVH